MALDTGKSTDRRPIKYQSLADLRQDLNALEAAHQAGRLRQTGNWTPGQIFTHLAAFINFAYDGYPKALQPPWIIRMFLRLKTKGYINDRMPAGVRIPGIPTGTVGADDVPFEEGLTRLRAAIDRLDGTPPTIESPAFGPMTHEESKKINLRHAELHLSFLHP